MVYVSGTYAGVGETYTCIKDTTALLAMWGHSYQANNSIEINGESIFSHSGSTSFSDFRQVDLKEGDVISISLSTGSSNYGTIACIFHNGGIY